MSYSFEGVRRPFGLSLMVGAVLLVGALILAGQSASAESDKYNFTARAIVTGVDHADKSIEVDISKAVPEKARENMEGTSIEIKVGSAKVFKHAAGKDSRVTYKNIVIGQELGIKGTAKGDDTFEASFVRIHDRSFTVVGLVEEHDEDAKTVKVNVTTSTYKPTTYDKGTIITMSYSDGNSTFYSKNTTNEISFEDLDADNQKVRVTGTITGSSTWEIKTLVNHYTGK